LGVHDRVKVEVEMGKARQTFERRQLGLALRRLRTQAGLPQHVAADHIRKARSRMAELEDGRTTVSVEELESLLDLYEVTGDERRTVLELGALAKARQKKRAHTDLLPGSFQRFADLEATASEISCYESGIVPGLLQSPEYLRAVMTASDGVWWAPSFAELHERTEFRAERQARVLDADEPKELRFVLTEDALRGAVGSPEVMREQRRHILNLLENKRNLTVRVLRRETYGNPAPSGGITVFGFGDRGVPVGFSSVVYGPSTYFDDESDTASLFKAFQRLEELAADPEESARLICQIDEEL
jgi:transcriptional regulator with XRE-family HTH domain